MDMHPPTTERFAFKGQAKEWFGIWIANLLLSIVTLGIYSAWAKVRTNKYFYSNTYIENRNFDYHATGIQIFLGRLVVIAMLIGLQVAGFIHPYLSLFAVLVFLAAIPWLVVKSLMFKAKMSSFSNIRFKFSGGVGKAALIFLLYPILSYLTLLTTFPLVEKAATKYVAQNHKFGGVNFNFDGKIWDFYKAFLISLAWVIAATLASIYILDINFTSLVMQLTNIADRNTPMPEPSVILQVYGLFYALLFFAFIPAGVLYKAFIRNAIFNNLALQTEKGMHFTSTINPLVYVWIMVSNFVVTVLSLGLLLPWTHVRNARYLADNTFITMRETLDDFTSEQQEHVSAMGDAYMDLEGIDLGIV